MKRTINVIMHIKQAPFLMAFFFLSQTVSAQRFHVEAFREDASDLAAIRFPRVDVNDHPCAIIKVRSNLDGILFDSNLGITHVEERPDGLWLYVSPGERALRFMRQGIITKDYNFPAGTRIESSKVYILELLATMGDIDDPEIETQWLIITSEPAGAELFINNEPAGRTPYQNELPVGTHSWRITSNLYFSRQGIVSLELGDDGREHLHLILEPDYGTLVIHSRPENGANIVLNGIDTRETTPATLQRIPSGEHNITLSMPDYASASQQIVLQAGEQQEIVVDMQPAFALVGIRSKPASEIYINNQWRGSGNWQGRLETGVYTLEARLDKHKAATERRQVRAGEEISVVLHPEPITGSLRIVSLPIGASIKLNGEDHGTTPVTLHNLLIGEYEVALSHAGHASVYEQVSILENRTAEVNTELPSGMQVTISSDPVGADLFINGRLTGETPYKGELSFGRHQLRLVWENLELHETIAIQQGGVQRFDFNMYPFRECGDPVRFTYQGETVVYGTVLSNGRCWMDRNLGASRVARSSTDEEAYGDLYQWGRAADGHQDRNSSTTSTLSPSNTPRHGNFITRSSEANWDWRSPQNTDLWQGVNGMNNPCPPGYRLPTETELNAERLSWSSSGAAGAFASPLKLPVAGTRLSTNGSLGDVGSGGHYWSSTVVGRSSRSLRFGSGFAGMLSLSRASGNSVRCLKD